MKRLIVAERRSVVPTPLVSEVFVAVRRSVVPTPLVSEVLVAARCSVVPTLLVSEMLVAARCSVVPTLLVSEMLVAACRFVVWPIRSVSRVTECVKIDVLPAGVLFCFCFVLFVLSVTSGTLQVTLLDLPEKPGELLSTSCFV